MAKTKEGALEEYEETLTKISLEYEKAKSRAKATLNANLKTLRLASHDELKAIRDIQQKKGR